MYIFYIFLCIYTFNVYIHKSIFFKRHTYLIRKGLLQSLLMVTKPCIHLIFDHGKGKKKDIAFYYLCITKLTYICMGFLVLNYQKKEEKERIEFHSFYLLHEMHFVGDFYQ